jgi:predicted type IV restriction endonuclease
MELNLPAIKVDVIKDGDIVKIYDRLRRKYVALTPEEWVRQHFVEYLISEKGFPESRMANEVGLKLNGTMRRVDTLVCDEYAQPLVIVEYKNEDVVITQQVFDQIVRYNMVLQARYLIVSNGKTHYCCEINLESHSYKFLPEIPNYKELKK